MLGLIVSQIVIWAAQGLSNRANQYLERVGQSRPRFLIMRKAIKWLTAPAVLPVLVRVLAAAIAAALLDPAVAPPPVVAAALAGLCEAGVAARPSSW